MKSLIGQKHNRPIMNVQDCLDKKNQKPVKLAKKIKKDTTEDEIDSAMQNSYLLLSKTLSYFASVLSKAKAIAEKLKEIEGANDDGSSLERSKICHLFQAEVAKMLPNFEFLLAMRNS